MAEANQYQQKANLHVGEAPVEAANPVPVNVVAGGAGDGAILDGVSSSIKATVKDLTNSNPLAVAITDANGDQVSSFGGGVQYTEGDTDATITGTAAMWEDAGDTLRPVSAAKPLPVNVVAGGAAGGTSMVDDSAFTPAGSSVTPAGYVYDDATPDSVDEGDVGAPRMSANRNPYAQIRDGLGNERGAAVSAANALKVDGSAVTQPVSGAVSLAAELPAGTQNIGDVDIASLPNEGQQTMANSISVAIASNQSAVPVSGPLTDAQLRASAVPIDQADTAALDYDSGAGTVNQTVMGLALPGAGGPVAGGTSTNPVRTDPTGTTTQPVSAASLPLPTGAATSAKQDSTETLIGAVTEAAPGTDTASSGLNGRLQRIAQRLSTLIGLLPSALVGGRLDVNLGAAPATVTVQATNLDVRDLSSGQDSVAIGGSLPSGSNNIGDVDVLSTVLPAGGTPVCPAAVSVTTTATALAAQACKEVLLQADPDNTVDVLIGDATNQTIQLLPGQALVLPVSNGNLIRHKTASGTASLNVLYTT